MCLRMWGRRVRVVLRHLLPGLLLRRALLPLPLRRCWPLLLRLLGWLLPLRLLLLRRVLLLLRLLPLPLLLLPRLLLLLLLVLGGLWRAEQSLQ